MGVPSEGGGGGGTPALGGGGGTPASGGGGAADGSDSRTSGKSGMLEPGRDGAIEGPRSALRWNHTI